MTLGEYLEHHDLAGCTVRIGNVTVTCDVDGLDPFEYMEAVDEMTLALTPWLERPLA